METPAGHNAQSHFANATSSTNMTSLSMPQSYFVYGDHSGLMLYHIAVMTVGWFFVLPIGVVLSITKSRIATLVQLAFCGSNTIGLLLGAIYSSKTPDLYPSNSHSRIGWFSIWVVLAQTIMILMSSFSSRNMGRTSSTPVLVETMVRHPQDHSADSQNYGGYPHNGREDEPLSPRGNSISGTTDCDEDLSDRVYDPEDVLESDLSEKRCLLDNAAVNRIFPRLPPRLSQKANRILNFSHDLVSYTILLLGFLAITSGIVVYGGVFRGSNVFNGLAHFVKGGIFFWYGLLTLGRWMGCFAEVGWAWNLKPPASIVSPRKAHTPSAEFVESFVIFLYGSCNVFMEHMAAWGDPWTAQDLEHVSISIMFFGGGLCGMLVESRRIRDLLNTAILFSPANSGKDASNEHWISPKSYGTSMNPFPGLIILLLGLMMSSHHQASMVSTMVHKQWGTLFVGFALARAVTYILMYLSPPCSYLPSRPPSEIIASFCLISGGLIFMASNKDTVGVMERYDLNAIFVFTITMGFTAFLMAWTVLVLAIKGWAARRSQSAYLTAQSSTA